MNTEIDIDAQALAFITATGKWNNKRNEMDSGIHLMPTGELFVTNGFMLAIAKGAHTYHGEKPLTMSNAPTTIKKQTKGICRYNTETGILTTPKNDVYSLPPKQVNVPNYKQILPDKEATEKYGKKQIGLNLEYVSRLHRALKTAGLRETAVFDLLQAGATGQIVYEHHLDVGMSLYWLLVGTRLS